MKIRSVDELVSGIDRSYAWRRKELAVLRTNARNSTGPQRDLLLRAGTALLYAHWEGFIRESLHMYVAYLRHRRPNYGDLRDGLFAACITRELARDDKSLSATGDLLRNNSERRARLPSDKDIETGGNLTYARTLSLIEMLGLSISGLATKEKLIDVELVARRNKVAHGEHLQMDLDDYLTVEAAAVALMDELRACIENECVTVWQPHPM